MERISLTLIGLVLLAASPSHAAAVTVFLDRDGGSNEGVKIGEVF